tara:strand:+ start:635 stop:853 length:219 start_codon:yes stop_codon:yes gene_type:complete
MEKKNLIGILYVSVWVIIWGTIGSLIDFPLLQANLYKAGSLGQLTTFTLSGLVCTIISIYLFPKLIESRFDK